MWEYVITYVIIACLILIIVDLINLKIINKRMAVCKFKMKESSDNLERIKKELKDANEKSINFRFENGNMYYYLHWHDRLNICIGEKNSCTLFQETSNIKTFLDSYDTLLLLKELLIVAMESKRYGFILSNPAEDYEGTISCNLELNLKSFREWEYFNFDKIVDLLYESINPIIYDNDSMMILSKNCKLYYLYKFIDSELKNIFHTLKEGYNHQQRYLNASEKYSLRNNRYLILKSESKSECEVLFPTDVPRVTSLLEDFYAFDNVEEALCTDIIVFNTKFTVNIEENSIYINEARIERRGNVDSVVIEEASDNSYDCRRIFSKILYSIRISVSEEEVINYNLASSYLAKKMEQQNKNEKNN